MGIGSAGEIGYYLGAATADYTATSLTVVPQEVMAEFGEFDQETVKYDDGSVCVITHSDTPSLYFKLRWNRIRKSDADTILDFYFDATKGKGKARTFLFPHPVDGNTYVVRFWSDITRDTFPGNWRRVTEITLKAEGYKTP